MRDLRCPSDDELMRKLAYLLVVGPPAADAEDPQQRPAMCPLPVIEQRLRMVAAARRRLGWSTSAPPLHCAMSVDPLDFVCATEVDGAATCADVAALWRAYLGHGLELVTVGSRGNPRGRRVLAAFHTQPRLVSGITLRVLVGHRTMQPREHLVADVKTLMRLWGLDAVDSAGRPRGRKRLLVEVVHLDNESAEDAARSVIAGVLSDAGVSAPTRTRLLCDTTSLTFTTYSNVEKSLPVGAGIGVEGTAFVVDLGSRRPRVLHGSDRAPRRWPAEALPAPVPRGELAGATLAMPPAGLALGDPARTRDVS